MIEQRSKILKHSRTFDGSCHFPLLSGPHTISFTDNIIIYSIYITDSVVLKRLFFYTDSTSVLTLHDQ